MRKIVAGIDLGGTRIKALALDAAGTCLAEAGAATRDGEWVGEEPAFVAAVRSVLNELEEKVGKIVAAGLSAPGLASRDGRCINFMPGRMDGLENLDWPSALDRPAVTVLNDAHAALLGEHWLGAARGTGNVIMLTLGTGVGGAIISDGRLLRGHIGRAGHLGHISISPEGEKGITGMPGTLEETFSEVALRRQANGRWASVEELVAAARNGNSEARTIWRNAIRQFARGLAGLINVLDPQRVVLGGGIAQAGKDLFEPLAEALDEWEWRPGGSQVELAPAELGAQAGAFGAAKAALELVSETEAPPVAVMGQSPAHGHGRKGVDA